MQYYFVHLTTPYGPVHWPIEVNNNKTKESALVKTAHTLYNMKEITLSDAVLAKYEVISIHDYLGLMGI